MESVNEKLGNPHRASIAVFLMIFLVERAKERLVCCRHESPAELGLEKSIGLWRFGTKAPRTEIIPMT
jgi:hypothetical protein